VVDDFEPWRRRICATLRMQSDFQVIGEVSDGLDAVQKAQQLQPDLILLDIGLPKLNGIEAARRIRQLCPHCRILFVSEHKLREIVDEALRTGAEGYVIKSHAATELLEAIRIVLSGARFVSSTIPGRDLIRAPHAHQQQTLNVSGRHEVGFYSDDEVLLDDLTLFAGTSLKAGSAAVVIATEEHRNSLLPRLQAYGVDVRAAIEEGRYLPLDAADALSMFMVNGMPDQGRFLEAFGNVLTMVGSAGKREHQRIAMFGECVDLLCSQGNAEAAIEMEKLGNRLNAEGLHILCSYSLPDTRRKMGRRASQEICAAHSAVHYR